MKQLFVISFLVSAALAHNFVSIEPSIVGGSEALPHQYPFMVSIQWLIVNTMSHVCGGVLLNHLWVLTAAHCLTEAPQVGNLVTVFGNHDHRFDEPGIQRITVDRSLSIVHPDWTPGGQVGPEDVALMYLQTPVPYGPTIQPIRLPQRDVVPTGMAMTAGWGATGILGITLPTALQHAELQLIDIPTCRSQFNAAGLNGSLVDYTNVCTGGRPGGGLAVCSGDSGGPLFQGPPGQEVVVGIVSWGVIPCGSAGLPSGVFKRVSAYIDWITQYTGPL